MSSAFMPVRLGEILQKSEDWIEIEPQKKYKQVTIKMWGQGVALRQEVSGAEIAASRQLLVHQNQFILSRIDARNGAFGLVPSDLEGAVVSNDFPAFNVNTDRLYPKYLGWLSKTSNFVDLCKSASEGTTNRVRLKEDRFLSLEIPLPPLEEQRRIVARIETLATKIEEAKGLREDVIRDAEKIMGAFKKKFFPSNAGDIHLGEIATVIDPNPSHRYPNYISQGIPMISTVNFLGEDAITTRNTKYVSQDFYEETLGKYNVGEGDIIFSRKGKVGYARLHPSEIKLAMTHTLCVIQPNTQKILPKYLLYFTRSPAFIGYLAGTMNPNAGVPTLGLSVIRSAPLNLPSLDEQCRVVEYLDSVQSKVDQTKYPRQDALQEFEALLPAILHKAFNGEL